MNLWFAIVLVAAIWGVVTVMRARGDSPAGDPMLEADLRREIEDLRERIKVLERIATEDGDAHRLADEIESLRPPGDQ